MKYEVILTHEGEQNLASACTSYADQSADAASRWYAGIMQAIGSLAENPERCPLARENSRVPIAVRQLNYGSGRRLTHRIIFAIRPTRVVVHAVRHAAQQDWQPVGR